MSTNTSLDSNIFLTSFLEGTLGADGYQAFISTLQKDEKLLNAIVGRSLWAWVQTLPIHKSFDSHLPGMSGYAVLNKNSDENYNGYIRVNNTKYNLSDASPFQLAATLSIALGHDDLEVPTGVRKEVLSKLGKSVDLLIKSRYLGIAKSHRRVFKKNQIEKKVLDPSLGYKLHAEHHDLGDGRAMTKVHALSPTGEHVGSASFLHLGDSLVPGSVVVHEDHQRQGLASAMYNHAQTATKKLIKPSSNQTDEGQALWMGNKLNPQFGAQVSKSLATLEKRFLGAYFTDIKKALPEDEKQVLEDHLRELGFGDYDHNPKLGATRFDILTDPRDRHRSLEQYYAPRDEPSSQLFETFEGPHRPGLSNHGIGITSTQLDHSYWSSLGQEVGLNKGVPPAALHSTLEGFFGQLKTLPHEGPARGNFVTAHLNHAPFVAALQAHPQGPKMATTLNGFVNSKANAGIKPGATKVVAKTEVSSRGKPSDLTKATPDKTNSQAAADISGDSQENQMLQGAVDGAKKQKFINAFLAPEPFVDRRSRLLNEAMNPNSRLVQTFKDYHQPFEGRPASHVYYHPGSAEFTTHHQALNGPELTAKHAWMTGNHPQGKNDRRWLHFPPGQDSPDFISHDEKGQLYYHKNFHDWAKRLNPIAVDLEDQSSLVKGWPKDDAENTANMQSDAVLKDHLLGHGTVATTDTIPYVNPVQVSGKGSVKTLDRIDQAARNSQNRNIGAYNWPAEPAAHNNLRATIRSKPYGSKVGDTVEPKFRSEDQYGMHQWADSAFWSNLDTESSDETIPPYMDAEGLNYTVIHNNHRNDEGYDPNDQDAWDFRVRAREGNNEYAGTSQLYKLRDLWSDDIHNDPTLNEGIINHIRANYPKDLIPPELLPHVQAWENANKVTKGEVAFSLALGKTLAKGWPKDDHENNANAAAHPVMEDAILEQGGTRVEEPNPRATLRNKYDQLDSDAHDDVDSLFEEEVNNQAENDHLLRIAGEKGLKHTPHIPLEPAQPTFSPHTPFDPQMIRNGPYTLLPNQTAKVQDHDFWAGIDLLSDPGAVDTKPSTAAQIPPVKEMRGKLTKALPKSPEHNQELAEHDAVLKDKFLGEGQVHTHANPAAKLNTVHHLFDGSSMPRQVSIENREAAFARDPNDVNVGVEPHANTVGRAAVHPNTNTDADKHNEHRFWNALRTSLKGVKMSAGGKALLSIQKAWPTDAESKANAESHAVLQDSLEENGAKPVTFNPYNMEDSISREQGTVARIQTARQANDNSTRSHLNGGGGRVGPVMPAYTTNRPRGYDLRPYGDGLAWSGGFDHADEDARNDAWFWSQLNEDDSHLLKAWPKDDKENQANLEHEAVLQDHLLGQGTVANTPENTPLTGIQRDEETEGWTLTDRRSTEAAIPQFNLHSDDLGNAQSYSFRPSVSGRMQIIMQRNGIPVDSYTHFDPDHLFNPPPERGWPANRLHINTLNPKLLEHIRQHYPESIMTPKQKQDKANFLAAQVSSRGEPTLKVELPGQSHRPTKQLEPIAPTAPTLVQPSSKIKRPDGSNGSQNG